MLLVTLSACSSAPDLEAWCDDVEDVVRGVGTITGATPLLEGTYPELRASMVEGAQRALRAPTDAAATAVRDVLEALETAASRIDRPDYDPARRDRPTVAVLATLTRTGATLAGEYAANCRD